MWNLKIKNKQNRNKFIDTENRPRFTRGVGGYGWVQKVKGL